MEQKKYKEEDGESLSRMPISASIPFPGWYSGSEGRAPEPSTQEQNLESDSPDESLLYTAGTSFKTHTLRVNTGEDIFTRIITFSQQGSTGICVLCAYGLVSNVTLRQPKSSGGTSTHEGYFHLMSLKGSFIINDKGESKIRSGGICVKLAAQDEKILAGRLAGPLIAAVPVQVIVGTFCHGCQQEQEQEQEPEDPARASTQASKHRRQRTETAASSGHTSEEENTS